MSHDIVSRTGGAKSELRSRAVELQLGDMYTLCTSFVRERLGHCCWSRSRKENASSKSQPGYMTRRVRGGRPDAPAAPRIYEVVSVPGTQIAYPDPPPLVLFGYCRRTSHDQMPLIGPMGLLSI